MPVTRSILVGALLLAGCGWVGGLGDSIHRTDPELLQYGQYTSLSKGMGARTIIDTFGPPAHVLERDGKIRGLTYKCQNALGKKTYLRMAFDAQESLTGYVLADPGAKQAEKPKTDPAGTPKGQTD